MLEITERRLFYLALFLIAVAYFVGLSTEISVLGNVVAKLGYIFTGRNPTTGQFANYPGANH